MCQRFENSRRCGSHKAYGYETGHHPRHNFQRKLHKMKRFGGGWNYPPANVQEHDDKYELYVYAPGLQKSSFQIGVADGILIIKTDPQNQETMQQDTWRRREFSPSGFKRRFELNEEIDTEAISAKYEDGVLLITLPKLEDFHTKRREVSVE